MMYQTSAPELSLTRTAVSMATSLTANQSIFFRSERGMSVGIEDEQGQTSAFF